MRRGPARIAGVALAAAVAAGLVLLIRAGTPATGLPRPGGPTAPAARIAALLSQREGALRSGDLAEWMSTVAAGDADFRAREERVFRALRRLPLSLFHYTASASGIVLHTRLAGFDLADQLTPSAFTLTTGPHPLISGDRSPTEPWDLGETRVTRGVRTLVLSDPADAALARTVAAAEDDAIPRVTSVWGSDWAQKVVVVVPHSVRDATLLTGTPMARVAALATNQLGGGVKRIVVNPEDFASTSARIRAVILRHESTHVATADVTSTHTPAWLVEGYADLIGFAGIAPREGAPDLAAALARGTVLRQLPSGQDLQRVGTGPADVAYAEGWLACRLLGGPRATRLYRLVGAGGQLSKALVTVTGEDLTSFTQHWVAYVTAQLS